MTRLIIGNRNYSSWSLRAWLYMCVSGLEFSVERVPLYVAGSRKRLLELSPAAKVPVLLDRDCVVWDSLAIMLHLLATRPGCVGWPVNLAAAAEARSISAEMHSGFFHVRNELPMNIQRNRSRTLSAECVDEVARIEAAWLRCRERFGENGPWLFGDFSIADVMYAPVVSRFKSYRIPLADSATAYRDAVLGLPAVQEWIAAAIAETERIPEFED